MLMFFFNRKILSNIINWHWKPARQKLKKYTTNLVLLRQCILNSVVPHRAKAKPSSCLPFKWAVTSFWFYIAVLMFIHAICYGPGPQYPTLKQGYLLTNEIQCVKAAPMSCQLPQHWNGVVFMYCVIAGYYMVLLQSSYVLLLYKIK